MFAVAVLAVAAMAMPALAEQKIGIVDMRAVMQAYPEVKKADDILRAQVEEFEAEQEKMLEARETLRDEAVAAYEASRSKVLSEKGREEKKVLAEEKEAELRKLEVKLRETARMRRKQLADQEQRIRQRISGKLGDVISKFADGKGYTLILDSAAVSLAGVKTVLYHSEAVDITGEIVKLVGAESAETSESSETGE